ncbi:MAG: hypothetical protein AB1546_10530 [bacterium]
MCSARDNDGRLKFLFDPISTSPQFAAPGGNITVDVSENIYNSCPCTFYLNLSVEGVQINLTDIERLSDPASGTYRFSVKIPADMKPGLYDLAAKKGNNYDTSRRSVAVLDKSPDFFKILYLNNIHIGRGIQETEHGDENILLETMAQDVNDSKPDIVVITGITASASSPDELKRLFEIVEKYKVPTFVQTDSNSGGGKDYKPYFGQNNYVKKFGDYLFIFFGTQIEGNPKSQFSDSDIQWLKNELDAGGETRLKAMFTNLREDALKSLLNALKPHNVDLILLEDPHNKVENIGTPPATAISTPPLYEGFYRIITIRNGRYDGETLIKLGAQ